MIRFLVAAWLAAALCVAHAQGDTSAREEVLAATAGWVEAFNARDAGRITALYAEDAVFWGTISKIIRTTPESVREYFNDSTTKRPNLRIAVGEHHVRVYGDTAVNSGYYTSRNLVDGQEVVNPMRFTFVYHKRDGRWLIVSHHSSRIPSP